MKTTGTCDQREPGESFTVQMLPVYCMLRSQFALFSCTIKHTLIHKTHLFSTVHQERLEMRKCRSEEKIEIRCKTEKGRGQLSADQKHQSCYVATPAYVSTWSERCDGVCGGYWGCFLHVSCFFLLLCV